MHRNANHCWVIGSRRCIVQAPKAIVAYCGYIPAATACLRYHRLGLACRLLLLELYLCRGCSWGHLEIRRQRSTSSGNGHFPSHRLLCSSPHLWRGSKHALYSDWHKCPVTCVFLVRHGCGSRLDLAKDRSQSSSKTSSATIKMSG